MRAAAVLPRFPIHQKITNVLVHVNPRQGQSSMSSGSRQLDCRPPGKGRPFETLLQCRHELLQASLQAEFT